VTTHKSNQGLPVVRPFRWYRGDTRRLVLRWGTRAAEGQPITYRDLTNCTAIFVARHRTTRAELARRTVGAGITLNRNPDTNAVEPGWIVIEVTPQQSALLQASPVIADVEITFPSGEVRTPVKWLGELEVDNTNA
jgi:hypothetical protein